MKKLLLVSITFIGISIFSTSSVNGQGVGINPSGNNPDPSAILDVSSTTKGTLITRMTTAQRDAISNPAQSLLIYNTTTKCYESWEDGIWQRMWCSGTVCPPPAQPGAISGSTSPCQNTSQNYSVTNVAGISYTWTFPSGWTQTAGGTTNSLTVTVGSGSGNIQVVPSNGCGNGTTQILTVTPIAIPAAPTAGNSISTETQMTWNWNTLPAATGYKYNTVNNFGAATDNGTGTSYTQTGLTCSTAYTLYVWAYSGCGNSAATTLTQGTLPCCTSSGIINTIAGTGTGGFSGDGGAATSAKLNGPKGVAIDGSGNVYIVNQGDHRIRKITVSTGIISTIAGTGIAGYNGDGIAATSAKLNSPTGVALDGSGNVYIADQGNNRIRKITVSTGLVSTIAGTGTGGFSGDGDTATSAQLNQPFGVAVDAFGNVYISDQSNYSIRQVTVSTGLISTIAGTGTGGYNGDGIAATSAQLNNPRGVAVDASGNVYIGDQSNNRIRRVTVSSGLISTIAGTGTGGFSGDGGAATSAQLTTPYGVALDASGNVYVADYNNSRIRMVTVSTGIISTIAGTGSDGYNGDGITATSAQLNTALQVAVDASGNVYIADQNNQRIRKICH